MNRIRRTVFRAALVAAALASLSGCAMMGYDDEFACPRAPQGSPCMSALDAYHASDNGLPATHAAQHDVPEHTAHTAPVMRGPRGHVAASAVHENKVASQAGSTSTTPVERTKPARKLGPMLRALDTPQPIRTPAQVMRIYIAPWIGEDGDLTMPTYVFTQIEPRRWTIGEAAPSKTAPRFYPLQVEARDKQSDGRGSPDHQGPASAARSMSINR